MQFFRLTLNRQARSPWANIKVSSIPIYCGKSIACQRRKVDISLCARSEQAGKKSTISLRNVYENRYMVRTSMKYCVLVAFLLYMHILQSNKAAGATSRE